MTPAWIFWRICFPGRKSCRRNATKRFEYDQRGSNLEPRQLFLQRTHGCAFTKCPNKRIHKQRPGLHECNPGLLVCVDSHTHCLLAGFRNGKPVQFSTACQFVIDHNRLAPNCSMVVSAFLSETGFPIAFSIKDSSFFARSMKYASKSSATSIS